MNFFVARPFRSVISLERQRWHGFPTYFISIQFSTYTEKTRQTFDIPSIRSNEWSTSETVLLIVRRWTVLTSSTRNELYLTNLNYLWRNSKVFDTHPWIFPLFFYRCEWFIPAEINPTVKIYQRKKQINERIGIHHIVEHRRWKVWPQVRNQKIYSYFLGTCKACTRISLADSGFTGSFSISMNINRSQLLYVNWNSNKLFQRREKCSTVVRNFGEIFRGQFSLIYIHFHIHERAIYLRFVK